MTNLCVICYLSVGNPVTFENGFQVTGEIPVSSVKVLVNLGYLAPRVLKESMVSFFFFFSSESWMSMYFYAYSYL